MVLAEEAMMPEDIRWKENEEGKIVFQGCKDKNVRRLKIPETIDGKQVTIISDDFHYYKYLLSIEIPDSVDVIGKYAFFDCPRLEKITVHKNNPAYESDDGMLYNKGKTTLIYCPPRCKETSIKIPDSVNNIESGAFSGCKSLSSISIPSSVDAIWDQFFCCYKLEKIVVDEKNPMYESDDAGVLYNKGKTTLICCPAGTKETSIKIPSSVSVIKEFAFHSCKSLISVDIPSGITDIGDKAFENCTSLAHIAIPEGVSRIGFGTFKFCTCLLSVEIPDGITGIGFRAFENCTSLKNIEIPEGVSNITESFYGCESLERIKIPVSVSSVESDVLGECTSLKDVFYAGSREQWDAIEIDMDGNEALESATIHYGSN